MNCGIIYFCGIPSAPEYGMRNMNNIPILYRPGQRIGISALAVNEYIKTFVYFPALSKDACLQGGILLNKCFEALADSITADIYLLHTIGKRL